MSTPKLVAPLPLLEKVLDAADGCCQCTGQCGNKHAKGSGRCEHTDGGLRDKHHGPLRLIAAPADPGLLTLPPHQAARLPVDQLAAWCPPCHHHALLRAQHAARTAHQEQAGSGLFDL